MEIVVMPLEVASLNRRLDRNGGKGRREMLREPSTAVARRIVVRKCTKTPGNAAK
jgi:hypothetical protein